jgi:hypothetical protein
MSLFGEHQDVSATIEPDDRSDTSSIVRVEDHDNGTETEASNHRLNIGHLPRSDSDHGSDEESLSESDSENAQTVLSEIERKKRQRWQAQETRLAQSLDAAITTDLNFNLLGVSAERSKVQSNILPPNVRSWQSRYRWADSKENRGKLPPADWTSWPLVPREVPGKDDWFNSISDGAYAGNFAKDSHPSKPSAELEEIVCDLALEGYRKRWNTTLSASNHRAKHYEPATASNSQEIAANETPATTAPILQDQIGSPSTQHRSLNQPLQTSVDGIREPVFSADDERSHHILRPSVRNVLSKIDALLLGLVKSRDFHDKENSYAASHDARSDEIEVSLKEDTVLSGSESDSNHSSLSAGGRKRNRAKSTTDNFRTRDKSGSPPAPRDWSDVLGIASLTGWESDVVERAAMRCARLFGEGMSFTTFREDQSDQSIPKPVHYHPDYLSPIGVEIVWNMETLKCPHVDCPRSHGLEFTGKHRLVSHIRKVHKWDPSTEQMPMNMLGGVHLDGFLQPIHARQGWRGKDQKKSDVRGVKRRKGNNLQVPEKAE